LEYERKFDELIYVKLDGHPFADIVAAVSEVPGDFVWAAEPTVDNPRWPIVVRTVVSSRENVGCLVASHACKAAAARPARLYLIAMLATGDRNLRGLQVRERACLREQRCPDTFQFHNIFAAENKAARTVFNMIRPSRTDFS
jgi:hypothetical protein